MDYEVVIGMEVHVELKTESKAFCGCSTAFGAAPNTHVCPVCLGLPGVLPVLNRKAVEHAVRVGLALGCEISAFSKFDRKNYFYPDMPKNYQISQYDKPLTSTGRLPILVDGAIREIRIRRAHLEEDAGKLLHLDDGTTGVDFNRAGVPLLEIVSEPDLHSADEAVEYLLRLKTLLEYLGVSDCNMEEGSMRCEANVDVRPTGGGPIGDIVEIKNVASITGVKRAIEFEFERQRDLLEMGGTVKRETRRWNPDSARTTVMRTKELAHDYRYFPEPDLVPVVLDRETIERMRETLPELPLARQLRYMNEHGLSEYDSGVLTAQQAAADFYESCARLYGQPKVVCNWVMGELFRLMKERRVGFDTLQVTPTALVDMLKLIDNGTISGTIGKTVIEAMFATGLPPDRIVVDRGLMQISDTAELEKTITAVLEANSKPVADYRGGNEKTFGFLVGQVMRATKGKANPKLVNELLRKALDTGGE
ncbi:MAG: Asp-tRNA(Asn)/Glu-tRNA(Gln) amidotransferase subunit GatB [Verrucomicrobia bacterium]|nr:Asp-tRNA(Asn)/Glu-tRNA(Gln) amidotransferase subunit GatB [Verrucomicrobiota bacterium]